MDADSRLEACRLHQSKSLIDAVRCLDRGGTRIVLVTDDQDRLVGVLTDGDLRRALLKGAALESSILPHVNTRFTSVSPEAGRAEVVELMQALVIESIPIVRSDRKIVGLHLMHDVLGGTKRRNWAVVMAGGRGTRLKPITATIPKPMVKVAGRPILERILLHMVSFGIRRIFLAINHLGDLIEGHFGDGARFGCRIEYLRESTPLGTGGPLSLLPEPPSEPLVVMNGDLVTQADLGAMIDFHHAGGQAATVGVRRYFHAVPYGCLELDGSRITAIEEKPTYMKFINAGVYVLSPKILARVPRGQEFPITHLIEDCLSRRETISGFEIVDDWVDVGWHEQLRQAREGKREGGGLGDEL